jgi:hypothetical protein
VVTTVVTSFGGERANGLSHRFRTANSMYQNLIVRTRTSLAQLLPVLATVFGNELSTVIIISTAVHFDAHVAGSPDGDLRQGRGAQQA